MADEVRVWQISSDDSLQEVKPSTLDKEERVEKWIERDISVLDPTNTGLLVIGRQVRTDFGQEIDLLCVDAKGDVVIVELKRDKTPREVTAQALDYASWVQDLGIDRIEEIAAEYLKDGKKLKDAFEDVFPEADFPEVFNENHSIEIVASRVDDSTERIIRYLSKRGININFVHFQMFKSGDGREFLVRSFTVPPKVAEQNVLRSGNTKRTHLHKTLDVQAKESTNEAGREFLVGRLSDPSQEISRSGASLRYRILGRIRYSAIATKRHVHVIQSGRFVGDEEFWKGNISGKEVGFRNGGADLSFDLSTGQDFQVFQHTMENQAKDFPWSDGGVASDADLLSDFGDEDDGDK